MMLWPPPAYSVDVTKTGSPPTNPAPEGAAKSPRSDASPISSHPFGPRPVFVYQIQVESKADVQDLLMEYCKIKKPQ